MIENRHLRYFVTAARLLHITRAAEALHIAQPALTQNIRQLEDELGVPLFHRIRKRISLTEAGQVFLAETERTLQQLEYSVLAAQRAARGELGKLSIGFISMAGLTVVPKLVAKFRKHHPGPIIVLHELGAANQEAALRKGIIDVGLLYGPSRGGEFSFRQLQADRFVVALPRVHRLSGQMGALDLRDLADDYFILPSHETAGAMLDAVLAECRYAGFRPRTGREITTATAQTTLGLISAGIGVSLLPSAVQPFARKGVIFRPIHNSKVTMSMDLLWRPKDTSPVLRNLLNSLD